ncbi:unnamed protein product [Gemmataceae bacterium]|nr:unnamed protein product [Gemmataceae bacterium]VTT98749.1 unnamed protein product [Gemmataceae bacterium]
MSPNPTPSPELIELVAAVADGLATPEDEARLAALLKAHPAARTFYLDHTSLAAELQWEYAGVAADLPAPAPPTAPARRVRAARKFLVYAASLCAAALVGVFASSAWGRAASRRRPSRRTPSWSAARGRSGAAPGRSPARRFRPVPCGSLRG